MIHRPEPPREKAGRRACGEPSDTALAEEPRGKPGRCRSKTPQSERPAIVRKKFGEAGAGAPPSRRAQAGSGPHPASRRERPTALRHQGQVLPR